MQGLTVSFSQLRILAISIANVALPTPLGPKKRYVGAILFPLTASLKMYLASSCPAILSRFNFILKPTDFI